MIDLVPLLISFKLAAITTITLLLIAIPISHWLSFGNSRVKPLVETLISMPLVLPPSVIGFYLLASFGQNTLIGHFLNEYFNLQLVFTFEGIVFASLIYSLPFMVQPLQTGFSTLPRAMIDSTRLIGKSKINVLFRILLPNIKSSVLSGMVLTFAHTLGEFGLVLMIGGNIPNETRVASVAIYNEVENLNYSQANRYSAVLFIVCFIILLFVYLLRSRSKKLGKI